MSALELTETEWHDLYCALEFYWLVMGAKDAPTDGGLVARRRDLCERIMSGFRLSTTGFWVRCAA